MPARISACPPRGLLPKRRYWLEIAAAVSVGIVGGELLLDLDYSEDSAADVDLNVVMTGDGRLVEVQATAERDPFTRAQLDELLELARVAIEEIGEAQRASAEAPLG